MTSQPDFKQLAAAHGIELDKDSSMLRAGGADAEYFGAMARDVSGAYWMLRAPRRGDVQLAGRQEAIVLSFVRGKLPVVVPDWQVHTDKLIAYRVLPGIPAAEVDPLMGELIWRLPQSRTPSAFAETLGETLAKLHALDVGAAAAAGIPVMRADELRSRIKLRMEECNTLAPVPEKLWGLWQKWVDGDAFWPGHVSLVNGDIYHPHLFVDADYRVVGIDEREGEPRRQARGEHRSPARTAPLVPRERMGPSLALAPAGVGPTRSRSSLGSVRAGAARFASPRPAPPPEPRAVPLRDGPPPGVDGRGVGLRR